MRPYTEDKLVNFLVLGGSVMKEVNILIDNLTVRISFQQVKLATSEGSQMNLREVYHPAALQLKIQVGFLFYTMQVFPVVCWTVSNYGLNLSRSHLCVLSPSKHQRVDNNEPQRYL